MIISKLRKADPKAVIPAELLALNAILEPIPLNGYYVSNTEYFNIMPTNDANIDEDRIEKLPLGYILPENPFKVPGVDFIAKLRLRIVKFDADKSAAERLTGNDYRKAYFLSESEIAILTSYLNERYPNLAANSFSVSADAPNRILGYRDDDGLHLIQLSTLTEIKLEPYSLKLDVFSRNTGILESDVMLNKSALFIGCGSVGSLVAVEFAKAGVGSFMLVDMDVFGYHNICRHQCGIYDVGRFKTDAVADRIWQINPYAKIKKYNCAIQDVDTDALRAFCTEDAIIIGGADNRDGDHYACKFAMQGGSAFISIGCWERAFAGEIFYCLPGMPDYSDFLDAIGYVSGRVTQNRRFYTTEEELEKVSFEPGISADINFVTVIAVKIALDLLNRNNDKFTQRVVPHITQYTLVCNTNDTSIGGEQAEIFSYPLQVTTSITVPYSQKDK
nr:ThiF family adenylyltransferase [Prevotella sp.]